MVVVPIRLLLVAVAALSGMGVFANSALMTRERVEPGCSVAHVGNGPDLEACHAGWFKGFPNLLDKGCTAVGVTAKLQYWSCRKR